ncbi:hypothetical protein QR680_000033 [Steinernema hermaphroditum]|uniref:Protein root UVB sensitive/RUS domain-containing protein n=1 Tax=Steinernema hermaphroditum TaxID=289476 RepID=A0AA39GT95_9BILA|nr:hypothetical protein QR680_000033 [Steinernema hermaphroditum]
MIPPYGINARRQPSEDLIENQRAIRKEAQLAMSPWAKMAEDVIGMFGTKPSSAQSVVSTLPPLPSREIAQMFTGYGMLPLTQGSSVTELANSITSTFNGDSNKAASYIDTGGANFDRFVIHENQEGENLLGLGNSMMGRWNERAANGFDNFTERPAWRKQLRHVEQLLHRSGLDTVSLAKEINDEYEKCANRERPQFLDALFHIAVHTEEHNMFMCRFAVLLMEFLKNRFGSLEVQSQPFTLKPLSANAKHELSYLCTELIRAESRAVEGSNTQEELRISLTNVMHGLFKLLKQYVRVGVERFSSQREFIKMRALSNGARYASVTTRMSARIDLAGGWTDTPPITFGHANGVVNMAIKVGGEQASVLAATIVWLLKDGCGMVGRIVFAWLQGSRLDIDCKKWRLIADILNDFAFLIDLLAPAAGEWFICFAIDIEYENFKGLMTKEHWRLDVNHLGYDEWRFNVEL